MALTDCLLFIINDIEQQGHDPHSPILPGERVDDLLLGSLLASNLQSLVLTDSHASARENISHSPSKSANHFKSLY